jgi:hypothetical protein
MPAYSSGSYPAAPTAALTARHVHGRQPRHAAPMPPCRLTKTNTGPAVIAAVDATAKRVAHAAAARGGRRALWGRACRGRGARFGAVVRGERTDGGGSGERRWVCRPARGRCRAARRGAPRDGSER